MSKLGLVGAAALSLALAVATPAFAAGLGGGGGMMHVRAGGFRNVQENIDSVAPSAAASHCAERWAYFDRASGKYMGDDGEWRPCL